MTWLIVTTSNCLIFVTCLEKSNCDNREILTKRNNVEQRKTHYIFTCVVFKGQIWGAFLTFCRRSLTLKSCTRHFEKAASQSSKVPRTNKAQYRVQLLENSIPEISPNIDRTTFFRQ